MLHNELYKQNIEQSLTESIELPSCAPTLGMSDAFDVLHEKYDPASYVAKTLELGPKRYVLDGACASALYAMKIAQDALVYGEADTMLCGASCMPEPFFVLSGFSAFQALPPKNSGRVSMPLQQGSAGLTPGEGGAVFVLKRLADAERDGDRIYGTLLGVGLNNAGCGLPLKPHKPSEKSVMEETYHRFNVDSSTISYVEMHATGTPQGDACEVDAVKEYFANDNLLLGSTKGNFGHSLVAAGFAGAAKVLLSMSKDLIPGTPLSG